MLSVAFAAICRHRSASLLAQAMVYCLKAQSHYLNQYWFIIRGVLAFTCLSQHLLVLSWRRIMASLATSFNEVIEVIEKVGVKYAIRPLSDSLLVYRQDIILYILIILFRTPLFPSFSLWLPFPTPSQQDYSESTMIQIYHIWSRYITYIFTILLHIDFLYFIESRPELFFFIIILQLH